MLTLTVKGRRVRDGVNRDLAAELGDALGLDPEVSDRLARFLGSMNFESANEAR